MDMTNTRAQADSSFHKQFITSPAILRYHRRLRRFDVSPKVAKLLQRPAIVSRDVAKIQPEVRRQLDAENRF